MLGIGVSEHFFFVRKLLGRRSNKNLRQHLKVWQTFIFFMGKQLNTIILLSETEMIQILKERLSQSWFPR